MGQFYRARDTRLNRDVALKILPDTFALDADRRARFTREAQVLAAVNGVDFDVAKDGRFLLVEQDDSGQSLIVVLNWRTELRRMTGAAKGR